MRCFVPFAVETPKTRLSAVLSSGERETFATVMLCDVLDSLNTAGYTPTVVGTAPITDGRVTSRADTDVDSRDLSTAINARLGENSPVLVVMGDLPLIRETEIERLTASEADVTIAPGLGGGTNALVVRQPNFRVDYHEASYLDHRQAAADLGATVEAVDSRRLATDIDEPSDLAEVLIHGSGKAHDWLVEAGFELDTSGGRVTATRE